MGTQDFDLILNECIDRVFTGGSVDACLADYPALAEELRPLLSTTDQLFQLPDVAPSQEGANSGMNRMLAELETKLGEVEALPPASEPIATGTETSTIGRISSSINSTAAMSAAFLAAMAIAATLLISRVGNNPPFTITPTVIGTPRTTIAETLPTTEPTAIPTLMPDATDTPVPVTATAEPTQIPLTPQPTNTPVPTSTPTETPTETAIPSASPTPTTPTAESTIAPTEPSAEPDSATVPTVPPATDVPPTDEPTAVPTSTPEPTSTPTAEPTYTPVPTETATATRRVTVIETITPTDIPDTPVPTATDEPTATFTPTSEPTATPTETSFTPTNTPTPSPTATLQPTQPTATPMDVPSPPVETGAISCAIVEGSGSVTVNVRVNTGGLDTDSVRMEMIYQSAVLSNPSSEIGSDFDTVGLGGSEADLGDGTTLLLRTYGRSDSIGTASGDLDFVTITFDWTGDATEIIFNPVGSGTGQGSFQMIVGELSPLGVEACSLAPAVATETPEPTVTPTATPTATPTETPTVEPTNTVEVEPTAEVIAAATSTPLPTATFTPTPTPTSTPQPTDTPTVVPTETAVPTTVTLPVTEGESLTIYQSEDPIFDAFPEIGHDETCGLIEGVNETLIRWNLAEIPADATLESVRFTITFSDSFIGLPFIKITTLSQAWEAGETLESIQGAKRIILFDPQENLDSDIIEVNSGSPPTFTMVFSAETVNDFATWRDDFINNGVVLSAALGNSSYSFDCYGYGERENGDPSINFPELELIYNVP